MKGDLKSKVYCQFYLEEEKRMAKKEENTLGPESVIWNLWLYDKKKCFFHFYIHISHIKMSDGKWNINETIKHFFFIYISPVKILFREKKAP